MRFLVFLFFVLSLQSWAGIDEKATAKSPLQELTDQLKSSKEKPHSDPENVLRNSLVIYSTNHRSSFAELSKVWAELRKHADSVFFEKRIDAFLANAKSMAELAKNPSKSKLFIKLDALKQKFPKVPPGKNYDHQRYAEFQLLAAIAARENQKTESDHDLLYIEGSSVAWLEVGGDLQLEEAIRASKGKSPWSKPALVEFESYLSSVNHGQLPDLEKQRIQKLKKIF